jgi:hypothetical protein
MSSASEAAELSSMRWKKNWLAKNADEKLKPTESRLISLLA